MRTIKFRASWYKEMCQVSVIEFTKNGDVKRIKVIGSEKWLYPNNNIVLMQFTGLLDKNGKEIYEGDVLQVQETVSVLGSPKTNQELVRFLGVVEYDQEGADYQISGKEIVRGFTDNQIREVIGNIYQNPELLK